MKTTSVLHGLVVGLGAIATATTAVDPDTAQQLINLAPALIQSFVPVDYVPVATGLLTAAVALLKVLAKKAPVTTGKAK